MNPRGDVLADAPPCGCQHATAGGWDPSESPTMSSYSLHDRFFTEGSWQRVVMGGDTPIREARGVLQSADEHGRPMPEGPFLHAFLKFRLPGDARVYMVRASVDLRQIQQEVMAALNARAPGITSAASGGKVARKIRKGLKTAVQKIAKSKIVKAVVNVAKKVWNNPLIKGIVSATPIGAAINATAAAARVAAKAIKGAVKAKATLRSIAQRARGGDQNAIKAARLVQAGIKMTGIQVPATTAKLSTAAAGGEANYLAAVLGACADCTPRYAHVPRVVGCGADEGDVTAQEVDTLETCATSGAFEGLRWLVSRLSLHGAANRPGELGTKQLLLLGQQALEQRA